MKDYSSKAVNFNKITLAQVTSLIKILQEANLTDARDIKRRYNSVALNFDETLNFLTVINFAKVNQNNDLSLSKSYKNLKLGPGTPFKDKLWKTIFEPKVYKKVGSENFLATIKEKDGSYFYSPAVKNRIKESGLRNFLIEVGFLLPAAERYQYRVVEKAVDYILSLPVSRLSSEELSLKLINLAKLGLLAEKEILKYEHHRLDAFPTIANKIEHTSQFFVNAGYDIKSFSVGVKKQSFKTRYIEVKAVSLADRKFYWSRNEMETAKLHGESYYLYLLPVSSKQTFRIDDLIIINNPYKKLFDKKSEWLRTCELMSFTQA